jgi:hypothetical protein
MHVSIRPIAAAFTLAAAVVALPAQAAPIQLSYSMTNDGTSNVTTSTGVTTGLAVPGSHTYGNSHGALSNLIVNPSTNVNTAFEFYDDFVFTIADAAANSITSTIDFGDIFEISNLQVRLYNAAGQSSLPVVGTPVGGVIDAWSTAISYNGGTGTVAVLENTILSAGTYVLEVRGNITGQFGGSYSGVLNVAPVPVPAALWLFGSGIAGLIAARRRRV